MMPIMSHFYTLDRVLKAKTELEKAKQQVELAFHY